MSKLQLYDGSGSVVGDVDVPEELLKEERGAQAVHDVVVAHMAALRAGTASTLRKGAVAGSNRKPWRQKGLGRARAGYRQSPVWRGGGVAFGPHPRSYRKKVNKKVARLAFKRAFGEKVRAGEVKVVEELSLGEPKTKVLVALLASLGVSGGVLLVVEKMDRNLALSSRNIPKVDVVRGSDLSAFQLLKYPNIVITKSGLEAVNARLGNGQREEK